MTRWNIKRILFYSHDERLREIRLRIGRVNIITGDSHTGKSGIAEVIDYVLGSSECHIPGVIRDATRWVGLLWVKGETECLLCRRVPSQSEKTSSEYSLVVGRDLTVPQTASSLAGKTTRGAALKKFEQLLGIGAVESEVFGAPQRTPARISVRHFVPYLLQDDQHIINKAALLRGASDEHKQSIVDTLPYFLGVVDEKSYAEQSVLARLRIQVELEERQIEAQRRLTRRDTETAASLIEESRQVGLIPPIDAPASSVDALTVLRAVANDDPPPNPFPDDARLNELYDDERRLLERSSGIRARAEEMKRMLRAYEGYVGSASEQRGRLEAVDLIPNRRASDSCPLCAQRLPRTVDAVEQVRAAFDALRGELDAVDRDRPKLDGVLRELEQKRAEVASQLQRTRRLITSLIRESRFQRRGFDLAQRQYRVRGRISLFLEAADALAAPERPNISRLRSEIAELEEKLNPAAKRAELDGARVRLLDFARDIMGELPLEERYRGNPVDFNPRTLDVGIATAKRRITMQDLGSDENYLTLHVALVLALHRVFAERERPVPGFVLFDQLSRPYYPPFLQKEVVAESSSSSEVRNLRTYFAKLFKEVERGDGLQVLILEKAYFENDPEYVSAVVERWIGDEKLIPRDWPDA